MSVRQLHARGPEHSAPQRGAALIVLLALVAIVGVALVLQVGYAAADRTDRDKKTALALGQARDALVARAAMDANRPGSLPCPDINNDGIADGVAGNCTAYVGRLPWSTLKLPDLRDGSGERLWYALSTNFRDNPTGGPINSDTSGTLTVTGSAPANGVIAIVFAPGDPVGTQVRDSANENNIANYLEGENANGDTTYSNAPVSDTFNDRLLVITPNDLMPAVERRVAREAKVCLDAFSKQAGANNRYPWAAPVTDVIAFADASGTTFGRIPISLTNTRTDLSDPTLIWPNLVNVATPCFQTGSWWDYWRELLFYQVSNAYEPGLGPPGACPANCLTVNGVGSVVALVIVAGRTISASPDQSTRPSLKSLAANYLETDPATGINNAIGYSTGNYVRAPVAPNAATQFNDKLECLHITQAWPCGS